MSRRTLLVIAIALAGLGALALGAWKAGIIPGQDNSFGAIDACEGNLKDRLRSPSTYSRVKATFSKQPPLTFEEFVRFQRTRYCGVDGMPYEPCTDANAITIAYSANERLKERGITRPTRSQRERERTEYLRWLHTRVNERAEDGASAATVIIEYDAANAYGTPIRDAEVCRFGPRTQLTFTRGDLFDPI